MKNRLYLHLMANREKGFALPLALLIGLILMVTGMTMMMRVQGDQSKVIAQKVRADSLRSSEAGVARVQDLLNSVRFMATVDSNCTSGNCWERACSNPNDADTLKEKIAQLKDLSGGQWSDLGNNRYYRVVNYVYLDDTEKTPPPDGLGWGVLTLEGLSLSPTGDLNNIDGDSAASRNRVVVTIPILASPPPPSGRSAFTRTTVPALWISEGEADDGAKFQGDVVESPGCNQTKIQQPTPAPNPSYTAQFVGVSFPDLPPIPGLSLGDLTSLLLPAQKTFPRKNADDEIIDTPSTRTIDGQSVQVYEYIVDNINLDDGDKITIDPGKRVVFYVKGNINGAIEHNCGTTTDCNPGNLQIYAYNQPSSAAPQICLRGNQRLEAFIFAPDYSLGKTDDGIFIGAAWGKNWGQIATCASNSGAVAVTQRVEWTELIQDLKPQKFTQLGKIANWCQEPIDTAAGASECD